MTARQRAPKTNYADELVSHKGKTMTLRAWADELNLDYRTFSIRYARGLRDDELFQPLNPYNMTLTVDGETHNLTEWAKITGLPRDVIRMRAIRGWTDEKIFQPTQKRTPRTHKPIPEPVDLRQKLRDMLAK
jgi:hypothetical protein